MGNPNQPYHNEGFGWAFINIVIFTLIIPGIINVKITILIKAQPKPSL